MKIMSWNCKGMGHPDSLIYLKMVIRQKQPDCIFLMETKLDKNRMERIYHSLKFKYSVIMEAKGSAGGITLMWSEEINIQCIWKSSCLLHWIVIDKAGCKLWNMLACYGTPYHNEHRIFWDQLKERVFLIEGPWLLIGDFNEVVFDFEKFGGRPLWRKNLFLKPFINNTRGVDLSFSGRRYTWTNGQQGLGLIKERLDRAVANDAWIMEFPKTLVVQLKRELSDHCPILLYMDGMGKRSTCLFRFMEV